MATVVKLLVTSIAGEPKLTKVGLKPIREHSFVMRI